MVCGSWQGLLGEGDEQNMTHLGYAFSQNENTDGVTQASLVRRYDTTQDKPEGNWLLEVAKNSWLNCEILVHVIFVS